MTDAPGGVTVVCMGAGLSGFAVGVAVTLLAGWAW